jgi:hypothetical protein
MNGFRSAVAIKPEKSIENESESMSYRLLPCARKKIRLWIYAASVVGMDKSRRETDIKRRSPKMLRQKDILENSQRLKARTPPRGNPNIRSPKKPDLGESRIGTPDSTIRAVTIQSVWSLNIPKF